jgi:hypothetical protein
VTPTCGAEAASGSKNTGIARARLHEHQPRAKKKQQERHPPRKNRGSLAHEFHRGNTNWLHLHLEIA